MTKKSQTAEHDLKISVGECVLAGGGSAALPAAWFIGRVLWVGNDEVFVERSRQNGRTYRQHLGIDDVRAVGTIEDLSKLKELARMEVRELAALVDIAEHALGDARAAVWLRLDELRGAGLLKIAPPPAPMEREKSFYATVDEEVAED